MIRRLTADFLTWLTAFLAWLSVKCTNGAQRCWSTALRLSVRGLKRSRASGRAADMER